MKTLKIILIVCISVIAVCTGIYAYFGGFKNIEFETLEQGGEILAYEEVIGDYSQTAEVTNRVYNYLLDEHDIETFKGFGIFYDNPETTDRDRMRSESGCIIQNADSSKLADISGKVKIKRAAKGNYIVTEFPYKGAMSIMVGIMKVYPAMAKYAIENGIKDENPIMEIYDVPSKKIIYRRQFDR